MVVCLIKEEGTFYLNQITEEIKVNDINLKYNFKIKPVNCTETFEYKGEGSMLYFFYPEILDFTNKFVLKRSASSLRLPNILSDSDNTHSSNVVVINPTPNPLQNCAK